MKKTISKQKRIACNAALIVLILWALDFFTGSAFLWPEYQFRREERGNLLGPSEILGTEQVAHDCYNTLIVADAGEGVILWLSGEDIDRTQLIYREKYTDPLLVAAPGSLGYSFADEIHVPLVLFDSEPRAAQAEIRFTVDIVHDGEEFEKGYVLTSERTARGYFLFTLDAVAQGTQGLGAEGAAVSRFVNISANRETYPKYRYPVQVRFYDILGNLIGEETVDIRSAASIWLEENDLGAG